MPVIIKNIPDESFFYFVHSYYVSPSNKSNILATTTYDLDFVSALYKDNIAAVQFHPEKSLDKGISIYKNWGKSSVALLYLLRSKTESPCPPNAADNYGDSP